jgi:hypothetical protein
MTTDRILAIAREARELAGDTPRLPLVADVRAGCLAVYPAAQEYNRQCISHEDNDMVYYQMGRQKAPSYPEVTNQQAAYARLFAHAGTHYGTMAEAVERMGKQRDELLVACQGVLENLKYNHGAGLGVAAIWKVKQAIENAQETPS